MNLRGIRNWLLSVKDKTLDQAQFDPTLLIESPELQRMCGESLRKITSEMRLANALEAAVINERHAAGTDDEIVPNIFVTCPALGGMFRWSADEVNRRIRKYFPELDDKDVRASLRHLADRIAVCITQKTIPEFDESRRSWVHGWRDEEDNIFRL